MDKYPDTISWWDDNLIDWTSAGEVIYSPENQDKKRIGKYGFNYRFDSCIVSQGKSYIFLYEKLGTKGLLLNKDGDLIREINRSYYYADVYEYPAAFITAKNGKTYLAHCPNDYNVLEFEDAETGDIITKSTDRSPADFFHSRLEISPDNKYLLSKGWVWQPFDYISLFDIEECMHNPYKLDKFSYSRPNANTEINTASFINDQLVIIGSSEGCENFDDDATNELCKGQIGIWDIETNKVESIITVNDDFGNLFAIDDTYAWDMYCYPKVINIKTGEIVDKITDIDSGKQCSSIIHHLKDLPLISFNKSNKTIAIKNKDAIEILSFKP